MPPKITAMQEGDCIKWQANPIVNPITKRAIKLDGPTYTEIQKACLQHTKSQKSAKINKLSSNGATIKTSRPKHREKTKK